MYFQSAYTLPTILCFYVCKNSSNIYDAQIVDSSSLIRVHITVKEKLYTFADF